MEEITDNNSEQSFPQKVLKPFLAYCWYQSRDYKINYQSNSLNANTIPDDCKRLKQAILPNLAKIFFFKKILWSG